MQTFAVIPAAGRSQRMGQPKLLLPWNHSTLVEHVLAVWRASRVSAVVIVVHPDDEELAERARLAGALVVQPAIAPAEMKISVQAALDFLASQFCPEATDAWFLAPADIPGIKAATIDRLIAAYIAGCEIAPSEACVWVPTYEGKRGHPVLFPWSLASDVARLAVHEGINALVARQSIKSIEADPSVIEDLDTPADYARMQSRVRSKTDG